MTPIEWNDSEPGFPDHLPPVDDREGELTGNRRYRHIRFEPMGGLLLQVEYCAFIDGRWTTKWRDALWRDVSETIIL
jgi:hypothetical protein